MIDLTSDHEVAVANANVVRECFVSAMLRRGVITEEIAVKMSRYVIICEKPSLLGGFVSSCFEGDDIKYIVMESLTEIPEKEVEDATFLTEQKELHDEIARLRNLLLEEKSRNAIRDAQSESNEEETCDNCGNNGSGACDDCRTSGNSNWKGK